MEKKVVGGLILIVLLFFAAKWLFDGAYFLGDIITFTAPLEHAYSTAQRAGIFPLWSPDFGNGYPLFANGQVHFFYPPHMLLRLFFSGPYLVNASLALHVLLAAVGMYLFLRRHQLASAAAVTGSLLFVFGGAFGARFGLFNFITAFSWTPLLATLLHDYLVHKKPAALWQLALAGACFAYSGNPQAITLGVFVCLIYALAIGVTNHSVWPRFIGVGLAAITVSLLAAPFILSVANLVPYTDRAGEPANEALFDMSFPWAAFAGVVLPHPFGHGALYKGPKGEAEMAVFIGLGALAVSAVGIFPERKHRALRLTVSGLLAAGIFLALGGNNPGAKWIITHSFLHAFATPARYMLLAHTGAVLLSALGMDTLLRRYSLKRVAWGLVTLLVIPPALVTWKWEAGVPWHALRPPALVSALESQTDKRLFAAAYLADNAPDNNFGVTLWNSLPTTASLQQTFISSYSRIKGIKLRLAKPQEKSGGVVKIALTTIAGTTLAEAQLSINQIRDGEMNAIEFTPITVPNEQLLLVVSSDQPRPAAPRLYIHTDGAYDPTGELNGVKTERGSVDASFEIIPTADDYIPSQEMLGPNVAAGYGIPSSQWTGALPIREVALYQAAMERAYRHEQPDHFRAMLNRLGVTHVVSAFAAYRSLFQFPDMVEERTMQRGQDFFRVYSNPAVFPRVHFATRVIAETDADKQIELLAALTNNRTVAANIATTKALNSAGKISEARFADSTVTIRTTSPNEEFLVVRDTFLPGWHAFIDNAPAPIYRVDGIFRGIWLTAGEHTVTMTYRPAWIPWSVAGFVAGMMLLISTTLWAKRL